MMKISMSALLFIFAVGCGGGGNHNGNGDSDLGQKAAVQGSCDLRLQKDSGYCQDYANVPAIGPYKTACGGNGGVWSDQACTHDKAIGACNDPQGATINWFYQGGVYANASDYQTVCEMSGGTFQAP